MNTSILSMLFIIVLAFIIYRVCYVQEGFWGGYMWPPYAGQELIQYGRSGFDAATDNPHMIINADACPINPYVCRRCRG